MTTPDLARQILAAIDELETAALAVRDTPPKLVAITRPGEPQPSQEELWRTREKLERGQRERLRATNSNAALLADQSDIATVLRRCAADRSTIQVCEETLRVADAATAKTLARLVLYNLADVYDVHSNPEPGSPMADDLAEASAGDTVSTDVIVADLAARAAASATVHQEEDWFIAQATTPDVASQGRTEAEARANLREAVELYLNTRRGDHG